MVTRLNILKSDFKTSTVRTASFLYMPYNNYSAIIIIINNECTFSISVTKKRSYGRKKILQFKVKIKGTFI